jgi:pyruvate formate lyase activating enzyme
LKGVVSNIQRYSIHDGPGIRTIVFLKGCPLRCLYCCNPESQHPSPEIAFWEDLCQQCGACIAVCPQQAINPDPLLRTGSKIERQLCDACGLCAEACPATALRVVGDWCTVDEVMERVLRDAAYYRRSGGGVTLSGGEPLAQPGFAAALLRACHERNIHTVVETCGYVDWSAFESILRYVDLLLFDLKHTDSDRHRQLTGQPNDRIVRNLQRLADAKAPITLRLPLIPQYNLSESHLRAVVDLAAELGVPEAHAMPLHHLGRDKARRLERAYPAHDLPELRSTMEGQESVRWAHDILTANGLRVYIGG